jgi:hypothetical protein
MDEVFRYLSAFNLNNATMIISQYFSAILNIQIELLDNIPLKF